MASDYVELTRSADPLQESLIGDALNAAQIPFLQQGVGGGMHAVFGGSPAPLAATAFRVPQSRLKEAKDALCERGIVCDVSERLLRRTYEEVVLPLIGSPAPDFARLEYLLGINNKETARALFELTALEPGGPQLLEELFFHLAPLDATRPSLHVLTRVLLKGGNTAFGGRVLQGFEEGTREVRLGILDVLNEEGAVLGLLGGSLGAEVKGPAPGFPQVEILLLALRDENLEVREAAAEALYFASRGQSHGYDPAAPPEQRQRAIERFLAAAAPGLRQP